MTLTSRYLGYAVNYFDVNGITLWGNAGRATLVSTGEGVCRIF